MVELALIVQRVSCVSVHLGIPVGPVPKESIHARIHLFARTMELAVPTSTSNPTDTPATVPRALLVRCAKSIWMIAFLTPVTTDDASTESMDSFANAIPDTKEFFAM